MAVKYETLTGINYPDGKGGEIRVEKGEIMSFPKAVSDVLLADGAIVEVK